MIEFPLIFVTGLMGSSHCMGMCGPFAILLGASTQKCWTAAIKRQLLYSLGRIFTYAILGAFAGYVGLHLSSIARFAVNGPALLAILAGCFLLYQGLAAAGVLRTSSVGSSPCLAAG